MTSPFEGALVYQAFCAKTRTCSVAGRAATFAHCAPEFARLPAHRSLPWQPECGAVISPASEGP